MLYLGKPKHEAMRIEVRNIIQVMQAFSDSKVCIKFLEFSRWGNKVISPYDATSKVYKCKNNKYYCSKSNKYFDVKTGTILQNTKLPLQKWVTVMWMFSASKRGLSSCHVARMIGVTQKTAWKMLRAIRIATSQSNEGILFGRVEIDEAFVGGKNKNRHKDKKVPKCQGRSYKDKTPVFGMYNRKGNVIAKVVSNTRPKTLLNLVFKHVEFGSTIYTDGWRYDRMKDYYTVKEVDHQKHFYAYNEIHPDGTIEKVTTNGIENFWGSLKRSIFGVYYNVSKKHLQEYIDDIVFKFNTRNLCDYSRFELLLYYTFHSFLPQKELAYGKQEIENNCRYP